MVDQMDAEGFGNCTNHGECEAACPKEISVEFIARTEPRLSQGRPHRPEMTTAIAADGGSAHFGPPDLSAPNRGRLSSTLPGRVGMERVFSRPYSVPWASTASW